MDKIFFDSWASIERTFITTVLAYLSLVIMLRFVGNRSLTQLNAFDFVVNVALGSTLATLMLSKDVVLADGLLALFMLIGLQMLIRFLTKRWKSIKFAVKTQPVLLFRDGEFLEKAMERHSVTRGEMLQIMRAQGVGDIRRVSAVVLETNGKFSVIQELNRNDPTLMENVISE